MEEAAETPKSTEAAKEKPAIEEAADDSPKSKDNTKEELTSKDEAKETPEGKEEIIEKPTSQGEPAEKTKEDPTSQPTFSLQDVQEPTVEQKQYGGITVLKIETPDKQMSGTSSQSSDTDAYLSEDGEERQLGDIMEQQGNLTTLCLTCTLPVACCFWIPMLFFMAAANVPSTCKNRDSFVLWLKIHGLVPLLTGFVVQIISVLFAMARAAQMFRFTLRIHMLVPLLGASFVIWGWHVYMSGDDSCNTEEDVKPRTLAIVWLIMGSLCLPCFVCGAVMKFVSTISDDEEAEAEEGLLEGSAVGCVRETE